MSLNSSKQFVGRPPDNKRLGGLSISFGLNDPKLKRASAFSSNKLVNCLIVRDRQGEPSNGPSPRSVDVLGFNPKIAIGFI